MENENNNLSRKERRELKRQEKTAEFAREAKNKTIRRMALWGSVAVVLCGAVFGAVKFAASPANNNLMASALDTISGNDWFLGDKNSKITLIEYSDFQCPACASYYPLVKQLNKELGNKILFVYSHFPLKQTHKNAEPAAWAAETAGKQGKFWGMHDMIFENQKVWSDQKNAEELFIKYAGELSLDIAKFKEDFGSKEVKEKVESDYQSGLRAGVNATPTFFLNGKQMQNPRSYEELKNTVFPDA